jgi:site-specific DNA recombinase
VKDKAAYWRVSSEEQARKETIDIQRVGVRRALESRNIKLDLGFADDGVSGATKLESRPGGRALLQAAREGKIDEVFVWNWNRLARNLREFLNVLHEFEQLGVKVTCINQPTTDDPSGKLMRQMMGAFAEFDHAQILENTRNGFTKKAEKGGYNGGFIPFGLRVEGHGKAHVKC